MKSLILIFILVLGISLVNAKIEENYFGSSFEDHLKVDENIKIYRGEVESDGYWLHGLWIEGDNLIIHVSSSGGCSNHDYQLIWDGSFMKSNPVQAILRLSHDENSDMCDSIVGGNISFNIGLIEKSYIESYGNGEKIVINFEDYEGDSHPLNYDLDGSYSTAKEESPLIYGIYLIILLILIFIALFIKKKYDKK